MNVILFIIGIILAFSTVVVLEKIFKQSGLYLWIAIASVLANIFVCKNINMFGISFTLGNIMFASTFLATDILNEYYPEIKGKYYYEEMVVYNYRDTAYGSCLQDYI